jgi:hypothetical protein
VLAQMLHNPIVLPADVAVGFWLKPVAPGIMPVTAAQLLANGYDSPALRVAEGLAAHGARAASAAHSGALVDAGCWIPGHLAACAGQVGAK